VSQLLAKLPSHWTFISRQSDVLYRGGCSTAEIFSSTHTYIYNGSKSYCKEWISCSALLKTDPISRLRIALGAAECSLLPGRPPLAEAVEAAGIVLLR
jgi:hypothetical protein